LIWRDGANICFNGIRAPLIMDSVPFVYPKGFEELSNKIIYYETSRGCPFQCQYCLSSTTGKVRLLSLDRVKQELAYFIHYGVPQVKLVDRTFNCDPARAREIFKFKNHLLHSVAFRIPNRLILLDKSPDTVAIWDYEKPN
ncbi:MAG: radical SAM protein, partial [Bacteroidetes bacterium]|nr:radical SAM protein [Bacteroidota bacterium]